MHASKPPNGHHAQAARRDTTCATCGAPLSGRRIGRKRLYCSNKCRDTHRRKSNFAVFGSTRYPTSAGPQNTKNSPVISNGCRVGFAGRGSSISGPRKVIEAEVFDGREWHEIASSDGVVSLVAQLQRSPLVRS